MTHRSNTHLQNEKTEEIEVGQALELLEEVERQEGDYAVLGRLDVVILETNKGAFQTREALSDHGRDPHRVVEAAVVHAVVGDDVPLRLWKQASSNQYICTRTKANANSKTILCLPNDY